MRNFIFILSLALASSCSYAYVEPKSTPQQSYQQNNNYQQQIDHNAPEGTEGYMSQQRGGPGNPHEGADGTMYPSNNLQEDDPE